MSKSIEEVRSDFARVVCKTAGMNSDSLIKAFSTVLRENFLGPAPWKMKELDGQYQLTPDQDPAHIYRDLLVAIDPERNLNNGIPSFLAKLIGEAAPKASDSVLHIGAGVGYYSAVMAEMVGKTGKVRAVEVDEQLAAKAKVNLSHLSHVTVENSDAHIVEENTYDVILVNAGATHFQMRWLKGLKDGGRLIVPLTCSTWERGRVFRINRVGTTFKAKTVSTVVIYPCIGSRDDAHAQRLIAATSEKGWDFDGEIRFDIENADSTCWLKDDNYWLSKLT